MKTSPIDDVVVPLRIGGLAAAEGAEEADERILLERRQLPQIGSQQPPDDLGLGDAERLAKRPSS